MGSGELGDSMAKVHRSLLSRLQAPPRAVFLDTPAGFEVNADDISAKAVDYFRRHFSIPLEVASFKRAREGTPAATDRAVRRILNANYIFAGPGSPTYAVRNWQGTRVWEAVAHQLEEGARLVFASAAAIAIGHLTLPVYEIYKAGQDPAWHNGLDLLAPYGLDLAVVSHWNNAEGGKYDTRYCYMGQTRFEALEAVLPETTAVFGIDEHTACEIDLARQECRVMGRGLVTVRRAGRERTFPAETSFSLDELGTRPPPPRPAPASHEQTHGPAGLDEAERELDMRVGRAQAALHGVDAGWSVLESAGALYDLALSIARARDVPVESPLLDDAQETFGILARHLCERAVGDGMITGDIVPLIDLVIEIRSELRAAKQFALADRVREHLAALGIELEDTPAGTQWRKT